MTRAEWIVCERTNRWAAALRVALSPEETMPRIRETRRLAEIDDEIDSHPQAIVAVEVCRDRFAELLAWLTAARRRYPQMCCVALLDRSVLNRSILGDSQPVIGVLLEAGVHAYATSPRRLEAVLELGEQHLRIAGNQRQDSSFADQVWASLPWQAAPSPLG
jgi:hypothetical protein